MHKQPNVTEATRQAFIDAFFYCYAARPMEQITVKEIAQKAGYSRQTFYNYFKDPYELLESVQDGFISLIMDDIGQNILPTNNWDQFMASFLNAAQQKQQYLQLFTSNANTASFIDRVKQRVIPMIMDTGLGSANELKAKYAIEFYISGVIPMLITWLKNNQDLPTEALGELIKGILQDGILKQL